MVSEYGFYPCGEEGGIFLVEFTENVIEKQLYGDKNDGELIHSQIVDISLSFNGEFISFTEHVYNSQEEGWNFWLGVITIGAEQIYFELSEYEVAYLFPTWSENSEYLYYIEMDEALSTIQRLSIEAKSVIMIGNFNSEVCSFSSVPLSEYYLIGLRHTNGGGCDLGLIDIHTAEIYPFLQGDNISILGWETR